MQFFFRNCTHILTRSQGKKFEDMFLVKTASKGTSLRLIWSIIFSIQTLPNVDVSKVGNMQFFFRNCTHILTRSQGKSLRICFSSK